VTAEPGRNAQPLDVPGLSLATPIAVGTGDQSLVVTSQDDGRRRTPDPSLRSDADDPHEYFIACRK
jgi:hypothetical protein